MPLSAPSTSPCVQNISQRKVVLVVISFRKMPKALLIRNRANYRLHIHIDTHLLFRSGGCAPENIWGARRWRDRRSQARRGGTKRRSAEGGGVWGGARSPVWGSGGYAPRKIKKKLTLKSRIFRHFCKLKWSLLRWRQGRIRQ